jgi:hypothetical protein
MGNDGKRTGMKEILDKLTSYNLFNYLLPGVIFSIIATEVTEYNFIQENIVIGAFLYYFIGMTISRIGSLVIEPTLKKIGFIIFADYKDFVSATEKDNKIEILSEANNTYRTFVSMIFNLLVLKGYNLLELKLSWLRDSQPIIMPIILLIIFLLAYRKQTIYVTKRIKSNL